MMKKSSFIILVLFFFSCNGESDNSECIAIEGLDVDSVNLFHHYKFSVKIDINHLQNNNDYNEKFLVNNGFFLDDENKYVYLPKENLIHIKYVYDNTNKTRVRVPVDTSFFPLTRLEMDSIYSLTSALFSIEKTNYSRDTLVPSIIYDDAYFEVSLLNELENTKLAIKFDKTSTPKVGLKYEALIEYIRKLENLKSDL